MVDKLFRVVKKRLKRLFINYLDLFNWLVDWLIDWLVGWLIDWLVDWLKIEFVVFFCVWLLLKYGMNFGRMIVMNVVLFVLYIREECIVWFWF